MKTKNLTLTNFLTGLLAVGALFLTACGSSSSGTSSSAVSANASCASCTVVTGPAILSSVQAITTDGYTASLNLMVYTAPGGNGYADPTYYSGPATLGGTMQVMNGQSLCGIPAGTYQISSSGAQSTYYSMMMSGGSFTLVGSGGNIGLQIASIIFTAPNGMNGTATQARATIRAVISVNGNPCGYLFTY